MIELFLFSMLLGAIAGLLAGLFGLGGGVVIVPALAVLFANQHFPTELVMIMAIATSLSTIIFTATASIIAHHQLGAIQWGRVIRLTPGILLGASVGAVIADQVNGAVLKWFFIAYLIFVGVRMAWPERQNVVVKKNKYRLDYLMGTVIGCLSSVLGIGGGTLTVPYLLSRQLAMKNAVAVSSACGLSIAIAGVVTYIALGWKSALLPEWSFGYVYLPALAGITLCSIVTAPIGAKLANKLPAKKLKRYFSVVLFLIAIKMILG